MGTNSTTFPHDITHAVARLFDGKGGPHMIDATVEAERLLRLFPDCTLTVAQLATMIGRESAKHSGSSVMFSATG